MPRPEFVNRIIKALTPSTPLVAGDLNPNKPEDRSLLNKIIGDRMPYERFSPEAMANIAGEYLPQVGLGKNAKINEDAFEQHATSRVSDILNLKEATAPDGKPIHEKLSDKSDPAKKTAIDAVKEHLNTALKASDAVGGFEEAKKEYKESMSAFKKLLAEPPHKYHSQDLIGTMQNINETAINAIKKQQTEELNHLKQSFDDPAFQENLKTALNITDEQLDEVKDSLITDLESTHKKQITEFETSSQQITTELHKAAEQQLKAFLFMADLHKNDQKMQIMIEELAERNRAKFGNSHTSIDLSEDKSAVSSVNLDQLEFIQRLGGGKITPKKDENGNMSYSLDLGMKLTNPRYYWNDHHQKDMLTMAQAVRASGADGITMTLNFSNQKIAEERAREAFEACLKSGFPPEKIKLNVNGKMMMYQVEEKDAKKYESIGQSLYKDKQAQFQSIVQQSAQTRSKLAELVDEQKKVVTTARTEGAGYEAIKTRLNEIKREGQSQVQQVQPNLSNEERSAPTPSN